jgi:MFS family permease
LALPLAALEGFGQALYTIALLVLWGELALPERAATDQMLVQLTVPGLARMLAQPPSGWLFDRLGGRVLLALDALIVLVAVGALLARAAWISNQAKREDGGLG